MDELEPIDVGRSLALVWGKLMMQKRHDNALLTGVLAYLVSREAEDSELKAGALSWVEKTLQELRETEKAKPEKQAEAAPCCSFCGRGAPEVRLAAGARAFICESCVARLVEVFAHEKDDEPST